MKVNMNLGSKQNKEAFNDYFGEDMLYGNISTLSEWVYMQKLPVNHKPLIAIKINHNKQAFKLSERANDLSQLFDTLPSELNSIYSDYVEFNFSQKLKGMLTITVDWPHYLANLDQMNVDNGSFTDSLLKIEQFHNALNNLANEITPETKDAVDQTSDLDGFDDSTKQSEDDNMKELTQIAHANETGNSLPETENSQDANDLSNSDELNDSEMPDSAPTTQTTDNNPVKPEDDSTEDDDSTASDDANHETFDSTQTNTEPETADKETGDDNDESGETSESDESGETSESANSDANSSENDDPIEDDKTETNDNHAQSVNNETGDSGNDESSDDNSENPENRYVKLSSEKFDHMIELLDNLVTSKTETKPDTDKNTDDSTNNETPVNSTGTPSDNNDTSDETTNNKSTEDDTDDKHDDSDSNQDDSEAKQDDQAMANLIGNFAF